MRPFRPSTPARGRCFCWRWIQILVIATGFFAETAWSQALPQAGQVNKNAELAVPLREANPVANIPPLPLPRENLPDGVSLVVKGFRFYGNVAIPTADLQALVAPSINKQLDFPALDLVVDGISRYYRVKGFTVGRAYLPAQQSTDGVIQINIIEGHFGAINLKNTSAIKNQHVEQVLANNLCSVKNNKDCVGKLIQDEGLERAVLLLKDLPSVTAAVNLKPGVVTGTSELDVEVRATKPEAYSVGFDNYGSPSTGVTRINTSADLNNLRHIGDQLSLGIATSTLTSTKTGSASYSMPVGYQGMRTGLSFARSQYRLGAGFSATQAHGLSNALSAYASYPLLRSVNRSTYIRASAEVRGAMNNVDAVGTSFKTNANVLRLGVSGDHVDGFGGGGYVVYSTTLSSGYVGSSDPSDSSATGAHSSGRFSKWVYSLARQQALTGGLTLYGALNGQQARKNLDGSEQTGLGGPSSTRGYGGEAGGSTGANATIELRYSSTLVIGEEVNHLTYGLFVDRGWVRFYEVVPTGTSSTTANSRALGSYGLTLTVQTNAKVPTPTSWGFFLRTMYGLHSSKDLSTTNPSSMSKFWVQGGVNF
jgi:hemolysin activation/secretion protein